MLLFHILSRFMGIRVGSICNENAFITPSTNALGFYTICQKPSLSNSAYTPYFVYILLRIAKKHFNKGKRLTIKICTVVENRHFGFVFIVHNVHRQQTRYTETYV